MQKGALISMGMGNDSSENFFMLQQMPDKWFSKARILFRDANILYNSFEKDRLFIVNSLKQQNFKFSYFYWEMLESKMYSILKTNANLILPDFESYFLLIGFAFENILKGIFLSKNITHIDKKKINQSIKTHDLNNLIKKNCIQITKDEKDILNFLYECILAYGRYPVKSNITYSKAPTLNNGNLSFQTASLQCIFNPYKKKKKIIDKFWKRIFRLSLKEEKKSNIFLKKIFESNVEFF